MPVALLLVTLGFCEPSVDQIERVPSGNHAHCYHGGSYRETGCDSDWAPFPRGLRMPPNSIQEAYGQNKGNASTLRQVSDRLGSRARRLAEGRRIVRPPLYSRAPSGHHSLLGSN